MCITGQWTVQTEEAEAIGEDILKLPGALSVSYTTDLKQQVDDMLESLDIVIVVNTRSSVYAGVRCAV